LGRLLEALISFTLLIVNLGVGTMYISEDEFDIQEAKKALAEAKEKGTISLSELKRELNLL
jgi:hypothetical protein